MSTYLTLPEEITYSDTEFVTIKIPDNVLEFLQVCESNDHLVEAEAFVSGQSLGRIGTRAPASNPIRCSLTWRINVNGRLNKIFKCWVDGQEVGPAEFDGGTIALAKRDKLILHLRIPL